MEKAPVRNCALLTMKIVVSLFWVATAVGYSQNSPVPLRPIDEKRVAEIIPLLADKPAGFGQPAHQREAWDQLMQSGAYDNFLKSMDNFVFPPFNEEDYFSLSNGTAPSSARGLNMMRNRAKGLAQVTWAECLENKGRYIKVIEEGLRDLINQKSWVSPRNDYEFKNYNGIEYSVELTTALYAHTISQTLYLLGHQLDPALRKEVIAEVYKRAFYPVLNKIKRQDNNRENRFLLMTNNYNHVCLAGVVGAALTLIEDKRERAVFTYIGEYYSQNGLVGFGDDGYCSEGIGYFNYGFGRFVQLRECIWQATEGKIDLYDNPKVRKIAWYPYKMEIAEGVYPTISDSGIGSLPDPLVMHYLNRSFQMGIDKYENTPLSGRTSDNRISVMAVFPNSASRKPFVPEKEKEDKQLRSFFDLSAVLIVRPPADSNCRLGAAMKGGDNKEHHNHNDVGAYTVALGTEIMAGDPGSIPYTADIFNEKYRYTYKTVGSYGHPVPLVAGIEQHAGKEARALILERNFSRQRDEISMDIASAYRVEELKQLERTMIYSRKGKGELSFTDRFVFAEPQKFETAIITRCEWEKLSEHTFILKGKAERMKVTIHTGGAKYALRQEKIDEGGVPYNRVGICLDQPALTGEITINYQPI